MGVAAAGVADATGNAAMHASTTSNLESGTEVLNTTDGEPGTVLGAYAGRPGAWTEYEVVTAYGIEIWRADQMATFDEIR